MVNPTSGWDRFVSLGHPSYFQWLSRLGSVTARHVVVGVSQTAALNRGRHLCSAGRPSRWSLAHVSSLDIYCIVPFSVGWEWHMATQNQPNYSYRLPFWVSAKKKSRDNHITQVHRKNVSKTVHVCSIFFHDKYRLVLVLPKSYPGKPRCTDVSESSWAKCLSHFSTNRIRAMNTESSSYYKLLPKTIKFTASSYHSLTISSLLPLSIQDLDLGRSSLGTVSLPSSMLLLSPLSPHLDLNTSRLPYETKQATAFR